MTGPAPLIICADDDEGHAILIQENLAAAGIAMDVQHVHDGQAALDYFAHAPSGLLNPRHCVLLLDIRMPKVNGVEVLRQLRQKLGLHLPIIVFTTTDDPQEVGRCYELGCSAYVQKPVNYEGFAETVRRIGWFIGLLTSQPIQRH